MAQYTAKVFMNGRSQAIRLPKEFRFDTDEVYIRKVGDEVIITATRPAWDTFFDQRTAFDDDFLPDREDIPPQERESI